MKTLFTIMALAILACSCNDPKSSTTKPGTKPDRDTLIHHIQILEQKLRSDQTINHQQGAEMVTAYLDFFNNYPDDAYASDYLYKAADISMNLNESATAIDLFKRVIEFYPKHKKADFALFLQGFIYENQLKDMVHAKEIYTQVILQYPNTKIADDSKASINNLGKSDEELIREFEQKNRK